MKSLSILIGGLGLFLAGANLLANDNNCHNQPRHIADPAWKAKMEKADAALQKFREMIKTWPPEARKCFAHGTDISQDPPGITIRRYSPLPAGYAFPKDVDGVPVRVVNMLGR